MKRIIGSAIAILGLCHVAQAACVTGDLEGSFDIYLTLQGESDTGTPAFRALFCRAKFNRTGYQMTAESCQSDGRPPNRLMSSGKFSFKDKAKCHMAGNFVFGIENTQSTPYYMVTVQMTQGTMTRNKDAISGIGTFVTREMTGSTVTGRGSITLNMTRY